jgi:hypothetical protein
MKGTSTGRSTDRSAACATCGKTFARTDTLLRHEKNHHATDARGPVHRVTDGTFRACRACAVARSRCSGGSPCGRCNVRNLECVYPNKRRKGLSSLENKFTLDETPEDQHASSFSEIVFAVDGSTHIPGESQDTKVAPATLAAQNQPVSHHPAMLIEGPTYNHQPDQAMSGPAVEGPNQMVQENHYGYNVPAPTDAHLAGGRSTFDYSVFDEPLNWIPPSIYPSPFDADLEQDFSFVLPPFSENPNFDADYNLALSAESSTHTFPLHLNTFPNGPEAQSNSRSFAPIGQSPASSASDGLHHAISNNSVSTTSEVKRRRRKPSMTFDSFTQPRSQNSTYGFPVPDDDWASFAPNTASEQCSAMVYNMITSQYQKLCLETAVAIPFLKKPLPPRRVFGICISLYFEQFHPNLPIIHQPTFNPDASWLLSLAVITIGSCFAKVTCATDLREAFQEFLRRGIGCCTELAPDNTLDIPLGQARILNLIGLVQSDRYQLRTTAPRYHADLSRWCLESGILQLKESFDLPEFSTIEGVSSYWGSWLQVETLRRIGYVTWMLDCALGYLANARPLCNMDDARAPLPCPESTWSAPDAESWISIEQKTPEMPSLCEALEMLYSDKKVESSWGDLSQLLIIHALFQRTWEVGTHIKQPLSEWVPTGKARGFLNTPNKDNFWLPLYPLYANWRNSACDCLDVLHWQASSVVAKASGIEHALILQLHSARIILLSPFQEIQDLLFSMIGRVDNSPHASYYVHDGSYQPRNTAKLPQIRKITWRWLQEDQHKARLSMVHAGSVFWYVRRYSTLSFFEPFAVYVASLLLWTYGSYKSAALERDAVAASNSSKPEGGPSGPDANAPVQPSRMERKEHPLKFMNKATAQGQAHESSASTGRQYSITTHVSSNGQDQPAAAAVSPSRQGPGSESGDADSSSSSDEQPEFIHLDRPCDDEMVQHFVRNGHNMSGHMTNVGDICKVPHKVLLEGAKLLRTKLACWGVSREYYDILMKLAELRKAN